MYRPCRVRPGGSPTLQGRLSSLTCRGTRTYHIPAENSGEKGKIFITMLIYLAVYLTVLAKIRIL